MNTYYDKEANISRIKLANFPHAIKQKFQNWLAVHYYARILNIFAINSLKRHSWCSVYQHYCQFYLEEYPEQEKLRKEWFERRKGISGTGYALHIIQEGESK